MAFNLRKTQATMLGWQLLYLQIQVDLVVWEFMQTLSFQE